MAMANVVMPDLCLIYYQVVSPFSPINPQVPINSKTQVNVNAQVGLGRTLK